MDLGQLFGRLTDFRYTRSLKEAAGFYVAYLALLIVVGIFINGVSTVLLPEDTVGYAPRIGILITVLTCMALSYLLIKQKHLAKVFVMLVILLLTGTLALSGGGFLGLLIPAYLTMQRAK